MWQPHIHISKKNVFLRFFKKTLTKKIVKSEGIEKSLQVKTKTQASVGNFFQSRELDFGNLVAICQGIKSFSHNLSINMIWKSFFIVEDFNIDDKKYRGGSVRSNPEGQIIKNQKAEFKKPEGRTGRPNRKAEFI